MSVDGRPVETLPIGPLVATIAMQTLATMAAFSLPAAAPEIARDLNVEPTLVGVYISAVYGVGILSALLSPTWIRRHGAARVSQFVMFVTIVMLLFSGSGNFVALACSAVILGCGYGATAPASTHLLVPRTPPRVMNLVLSIRQIGVPLGGVLAGLLVPPLVVAFGWQVALLVQVVPAAALLALLQWPRRDWDADRDVEARMFSRTVFDPLRLLAEMPAVRYLSAASFVYAGIQLCFISFMVVHLTSQAGLGLVLAGQALAIYQISGVVSRPIWGWAADNVIGARWLLALQGVLMAGAAYATGQFTPGWPFWLIAAVCLVAGATASGFTGIAYGEFARLGGRRGTEATAVGSGAMFSGVMTLPSLFGIATASLGDFSLAYGLLALVACLGAAMLVISPRRPPTAV
jgi:MFS family permease